MLHEKIKDLRRYGKGEALLPSMEEMEAFVDAKVFSNSQLGHEGTQASKMELLRVNNASSATTGSSTRLLTKVELADVFGMKGWGMELID